MRLENSHESMNFSSCPAMMCNLGPKFFNPIAIRRVEAYQEIGAMKKEEERVGDA